MKDIKSLYSLAKSSGNAEDISAYNEAVRELLESNPLGYMSNLEYIISSNTGISTITEFVERWGLPISSYDKFMGTVEKVTRRATVAGVDLTPYKEAKQFLESFKARYEKCFVMLEYVDGNPNVDMYERAYYSKNLNGVQNRKLAVGMIKEFGEATIPDLIITADSANGDIRHKAVDALMEYFSKTCLADHKLCQLITECTKGIPMTEYSQKCLDKIISANLESVVNDLRSDKAVMYREAVIMGQPKSMFKASPEEIQDLKDCISFKEYQMTTLEGDAIMECYREIMSLYEDLHDIEDLDASTFSESGDPRKAAIKEIVTRLRELCSEVLELISPVIKKAKGYTVRVECGNRNGPYLAGNGNLGKHVKNKMSDISDFRSEWIEGMYLYVYFVIKSKRSQLENLMDGVTDDVRKALKPLINEGKIKFVHDLYGEPEDEYRIYIPFNISKTYAVGDTDIGVFESVQELVEMIGSEFQEKWLFSTTNKKTGEAPGYLSDNHDLSYGEDDSTSKKKKRHAFLDDDDKPSDGGEHSLEDFRRPSAMPAHDDDKDDIPSEPVPSNAGNSGTSSSSSGNNYYYYTYNNSLNRNSNSFNRSQRDDHSVDDHSNTVRKISDDHSSGKSVHSGNHTSTTSEDDSDEEPGMESALTEATDDRLWNRECRAFQAMFNLDLNRLGDVKSPAKEIDISIGGKKMTFRSSLGNIPGKEEKLSNYTQVPAAVHQFNDNKGRICEDKIGIGRCILHYLKLRDREFGDTDISTAIKKYDIKPKKIIFNLYGEIGLTFSCNIKDEEEFAVLIDQELNCSDGDIDIIYTEAVGDADDQKPKSDHPIKDTFQDIDRQLGKYQQKAKKKVQDVENVARAAMKPVNRTKSWILAMIQKWKNADENDIKDKMADPHSRNKLYSAIRTSIKYGAIAKAGLLFNPLFLALTVYKVRGKSAKEFRIRNEIIGEIKTELQIIDEKIKDADSKGDNKAKYQLMRLKNELNKKLLRVGGTKDFKKII